MYKTISIKEISTPTSSIRYDISACEISETENLGIIYKLITTDLATNQSTEFCTFIPNVKIVQADETGKFFNLVKSTN